MTSTDSALLDRSVLPLAELLALVLDGQLYRVGHDAFASPITPDTPQLRASAFAALRPGTAVADRGTAAWIHGTRSMPPSSPQVCVDRARRGRLSPEFDAHQHVLTDDDVITLSGIRVTTPLRTATDLLLTLPTFGPADALEVRHLITLAGASTVRLRARLRQTRRVGASRAMERLGQVEQVRLPVPPPQAVPFAAAVGDISRL